MSFIIQNELIKKDLDIVIVTYKAFNGLINALKSIYSEFNKNINFNVVIFPNYKLQNDEINTLKNYPVNVIDNDKNIGISLSINKSVELIPSDYFLKIDDDAVLCPECLNQLLSTVKDSSIATAGPKILQSDGEKIQSAEIFVPIFEQVGFNEIDKGQRNYIKTCDALISACQIYNKKIFKEMGGFSKDYYPCQFEDGDFCLRLRKNTNYKIIYNGLASIIHENLKRTSKEYIKSNLEKFLIKWNFFDELPYKNTNQIELEFYEVVKLVLDGETKKAQYKAQLIKEKYNIEKPPLNFLIEYSLRKNISFKLSRATKDKLDKYLFIFGLLEAYNKNIA